MLCTYRHQASEGGDSNVKMKRVASLLQQRKVLQRHLRSIQQHALSQDIIASMSLLVSHDIIATVMSLMVSYDIHHVAIV